MSRTSGERGRHEGGNVFNDQSGLVLVSRYLFENVNQTDSKIYFHTVWRLLNSKRRR